MAFDHTGVRVTSTPDCVFDQWHMKTVTVGLCGSVFFFLPQTLQLQTESSCLITAALICLVLYIR